MGRYLVKYSTVFLLSFALLLLGCAGATLTIKNSQVHISNTLIKGQVLQTSQKNLTKISIEQTLFKSVQGEELVYEYATLTSNYKFKYNYTYILNTVFNAKKVSLIKEDKGLAYFIIQTKENTILYTLVKTATKKSLTMIYGFSKENFQNLMQNKPLQAQTTQTSIQSLWNEKMIIMGELLVQEGGRVRF